MATDQQARLAVELRYFSQHKTEWLASKTGQYVVIKENKPLGFFPNFEAAYRAGAANYGISTDFLVKQILEHEPVFFVSSRHIPSYTTVCLAATFLARWIFNYDGPAGSWEIREDAGAPWVEPPEGFDPNLWGG